MKRLIWTTLCMFLIFSLTACNETKQAEEAEEWTRQGYFEDDNGNFLSVTYMELEDESGWYVGLMKGEDLIEDSYGGMLPQEGNTLHGTLPSAGGKDDLTVTISEEGEIGLLLEIMGDVNCHFMPMQMPDVALTVRINTDGVGQVCHAEEGEELNFNDGYYTSEQMNLAEPVTYVIGAKTEEQGWYFSKWTKNGEDYSTDAIFTAELTEDTDFVAVFEYDPFIGSYLDAETATQGLKIARNGDGTYSVEISIVRLTVLDDGVGTMEDDGLHFTATDAAGNPISGVITQDGADRIVTFTDSTWDLLENGSSFTYFVDQAKVG